MVAGGYVLDHDDATARSLGATIERSWTARGLKIDIRIPLAKLN
jgi:hypothetical protein